MARSPVHRQLCLPPAADVAIRALVPARAVSEILVAAIFVVVLLAAAVHGGHRATNANADRFDPWQLDGGAAATPPACRPELRAQPQQSLAAGAIAARGAGCRDLRLYV